jgi:RNA 3'-terminal phosphate cyclase-like protein
MSYGKVKRIRGVAFSCRVSPQTCHRIIDAAKGILLKFIPDVFIHALVMHGRSSGHSPGFGIILEAETTEGVFYSGESLSKPQGEDNQPETPEDIARKAADKLFKEISRGGSFDSKAQSMVLLFMALSENDLSKVLLGPLTPYSIHFLRHMKRELELTFKLETVETTGRNGVNKTSATCIGIGFSNLSKTIS